MHTIHKFPISIEDAQTIQIPADAVILSVQVQRGHPVMWVKLDTEAQKVLRHFTLYKTGEHITPNVGKYINTFQMWDGDLVFHVFENF